MTVMCPDWKTRCHHALLSISSVALIVPSCRPGEMIIIPIFLLHVIVKETTGLQCLYCTDIIIPTDCDTVITCGSDEECFLDKYVNGTSMILYTMGCRDRNQCVKQQTTGKREETEKIVIGEVRHESSDVLKRSEDVLECGECCLSSLCNAAGCGTKGYPTQRGPICSNCQDRNTTTECDKITVCGLNETCKLVKSNDPVSNQARFQRGCENEMQCIDELEKFRKIAAVIFGKRSSGDTLQIGSSCFMKCCKSDLCNYNCDVTSHVVIPTKVTHGTTLTSAIAPSLVPTKVTHGSTVNTGIPTSPTEYCLSNPCQGGTCSEYHNTYKCTCDFGYWGRNCENAPAVSTISQLQQTTIAYNPTDCYDIKHLGLGTYDGIYQVETWLTHRIIEVYCDLTTEGGGWTVFQKRFDGSVDFYRNFVNYTTGFGNFSGEFWLGLDIIHEITTQRITELRIDLTAADGRKGYEVFKNFTVSDGPGYVLHNLPGTGTLGDRRGLSYHTGQSFSTYDRDSDSDPGNCATKCHGGWWYNDCYEVNLNGQYLAPGTTFSSSMSYNQFTGGYHSLATSKMMFRFQS